MITPAPLPPVGWCETVVMRFHVLTRYIYIFNPWAGFNISQWNTAARDHQGRTKMTQNRRCRRPLRTPLTSSHQNLFLKIELCQNRRRHRSSRLHRVDVTSSHQNLILKIEMRQNRHFPTTTVHDSFNVQTDTYSYKWDILTHTTQTTNWHVQSPGTWANGSSQSTCPALSKMGGQVRLCPSQFGTNQFF